MTRPEPFAATLEAAHARIAAVRPADYARSRNMLDGAVTRLSPYLTHGFVGVPEVAAGVAARHRLELQHKFLFELGWREYFHHVWQHLGEGILDSLHEGPLPALAYAPQLPADVREGRTGVPVVDEAVRTLYATGYLHNHARMWLASYLVHLRKVHWRAGADWMIAHLLDGDIGSNHLSWQWVAGTGSHKPYLFNAENVARYAPAAWHSAGSVIDRSYEELEAIARGAPLPEPGRAAEDGVDEPALSSTPPAMPGPASLAGADVWLVHPWALGEVPAGRVALGWWPAAFHAAWPWSAARWRFVGTRMAALAPHAVHGDPAALAGALAGARSVQTLADPHLHGLLPGEVDARPAPQLFADVSPVCASFSAWWHRATRGVKRLDDLPGLAGAGR